MSKYDYLNCTKFNTFIEYLLQEHREQFKAIIYEGQLLAKTSLQIFLDAAGTTVQSISTTIMMWWASCFQLFVFSMEVKSTIKDLLFDGHKLFLDSLYDSLHKLKDLTTTLKFLGIYTPMNKKI